MWELILLEYYHPTLIKAWYQFLQSTFSGLIDSAYYLIDEINFSLPAFFD